jgi:hypothetical protein
MYYVWSCYKMLTKNKKNKKNKRTGRLQNKCVVLVESLPVGVDVDFDKSVQSFEKLDEGIVHCHTACKPSRATVLEKDQNYEVSNKPTREKQKTHHQSHHPLCHCKSGLPLQQTNTQGRFHLLKDALGEGEVFVISRNVGRCVLLW